MPSGNCLDSSAKYPNGLVSGICGVLPRKGIPRGDRMGRRSFAECVVMSCSFARRGGGARAPVDAALYDRTIRRMELKPYAVRKVERNPRWQVTTVRKLISIRCIELVPYVVWKSRGVPRGAQGRETCL